MEKVAFGGEDMETIKKDSFVCETDVGTTSQKESNLKIAW